MGKFVTKYNYPAQSGGAGRVLRPHAVHHVDRDRDDVYGPRHHDVRQRRLDGVPRRTPGLDGFRRLFAGLRGGRIRLHNVAAVQHAVRRSDFAIRGSGRGRESLLHRDDHLQWLPDHIGRRRRCCRRLAGDSGNRPAGAHHKLGCTAVGRSWSWALFSPSEMAVPAPPGVIFMRGER